jgi:hypothetical protein
MTDHLQSQWPCLSQSNWQTKRFQRGDCKGSDKGLWETALRLARKEIDTNHKRKDNRDKRDTSSIRARVVYVEHCVRKGARNISISNGKYRDCVGTKCTPTALYVTGVVGIPMQW